MRIIVCIKQVTDSSQVRFDKETNSMIRDGVPSIINPFDENAIESALQLKEEHGGEVIVICMGPPQAEEALRQAVAMGADQGILLSDRRFAIADTLATAYTLATAINKLGDYDMLLFGKQAIDGDTAQVGPGVAEMLNLPQLTYVRKINVEDGHVTAECVLEDSCEVLQTKLPAALTVVKEINEPRHASLRGVLKAKKVEIPVWKPEDIDADPERIGKTGSPTEVIKTFNPEPRGKGTMLAGEPEEIAQALFAELRDMNIV
ncbi:electron transfer flavoprotein subunit beta [Candidatus Poribacteria bacterium]|nr:electron transfer flavoprotein subunit beta [Candidatus Poribacteria bacterium]